MRTRAPLDGTLRAAMLALACVVPGLVQAQTSGTSGFVPRATPSGPQGGSFGVTIRHDPPPPPSQPTPPPASPLVPSGPPSALDADVDRFRASPRTYAPRSDRSARRRLYTGYGAGAAYIADPFGYISQPYAPPRQRDDARAREEPGYLRIEVEPDSARVYVDGLYAGTVGDFRRAGRAIDAGVHRVEIRADGFDTLGFEVRIRAGEMLAYRGALIRDQPTELRASPPPKTFYVIPRCYAGDSLPRAELLPAGCNIADVRAVPPVVIRTAAN